MAHLNILSIFALLLALPAVLAAPWGPWGKAWTSWDDESFSFPTMTATAIYTGYPTGTGLPAFPTSVVPLPTGSSVPWPIKARGGPSPEWSWPVWNGSWVFPTATGTAFPWKRDEIEKRWGTGIPSGYPTAFPTAFPTGSFPVPTSWAWPAVPTSFVWPKRNED